MARTLVVRAFRPAVAAWVGFSVALGAQQPSPTAAELKSKFEHHLQEIAARVDGVMGYAVLDLTSGERIGHLERAAFPTASTIKIAIVYELFKQADEGKVHLDQMITLDRSKAVGG